MERGRWYCTEAHTVLGEEGDIALLLPSQIAGMTRS
jgi:hypothetical protein